MDGTTGAAPTPGATSRVTVAGAGRMGLPIARRLHAAGHRVSVADPDPRRRAPAAEAGLEVAPSTVAAAAETDLLLTVLPGSAELEAVMADGAVLDALAGSGGTWIDLTSTAPAVARALAARAAARGVPTLEAPMGGGPAAAADGTLTLYVGGDEQVLRRWRPVLDRVASTVHHLGGAGSGCLVKLLVNLLWFGQAALTTEAALVAAAAGVEAGRLLEVLSDGPAASRFLTEDFSRGVRGDLLTTFGADRIVEELDAVATEASDRAVPSRMIDAVTAAHRAALAGLGPVDAELAVLAHLQAVTGIRLS